MEWENGAGNVHTIHIHIYMYIWPGLTVEGGGGHPPPKGRVPPASCGGQVDGGRGTPLKGRVPADPDLPKVIRKGPTPVCSKSF